jgi:hypothetical protein
MKASHLIDVCLVVNVHDATEDESVMPDPSTLARVFGDAVDGAELAGVRAKAVTLARSGCRGGCAGRHELLDGIGEDGEGVASCRTT